MPIPSFREPDATIQGELWSVETPSKKDLGKTPGECGISPGMHRAGSLEGTGERLQGWKVSM